MKNILIYYMIYELCSLGIIIGGTCLTISQLYETLPHLDCEWTSRKEEDNTVVFQCGLEKEEPSEYINYTLRIQRPPIETESLILSSSENKYFLCKQYAYVTEDARNMESFEKMQDFFFLKRGHWRAIGLTLGMAPIIVKCVIILMQIIIYRVRGRFYPRLLQGYLLFQVLWTSIFSMTGFIGIVPMYRVKFLPCISFNFSMSLIIIYEYVAIIMLIIFYASIFCQLGSLLIQFMIMNEKLLIFQIMPFNLNIKTWWYWLYEIIITLPLVLSVLATIIFFILLSSLAGFSLDPIFPLEFLYLLILLIGEILLFVFGRPTNSHHLSAEDSFLTDNEEINITTPHT